MIKITGTQNNNLKITISDVGETIVGKLDADHNIIRFESNDEFIINFLVNNSPEIAWAVNDYFNQYGEEAEEYEFILYYYDEELCSPFEWEGLSGIRTSGW